ASALSAEFNCDNGAGRGSCSVASSTSNASDSPSGCLAAWVVTATAGEKTVLYHVVQEEPSVISRTSNQLGRSMSTGWEYAVYCEGISTRQRTTVAMEEISAQAATPSGAGSTSSERFSPINRSGRLATNSSHNGVDASGESTALTDTGCRATFSK